MIWVSRSYLLLEALVLPREIVDATAAQRDHLAFVLLLLLTLFEGLLLFSLQLAYSELHLLRLLVELVVVFLQLLIALLEVDRLGCSRLLHAGFSGGIWVICG